MNNSFLFSLIFIVLSLNSYSQDAILVSPFITVDGEKIITTKIPQLDIIEFIDNAERRRFQKLKRRVLKVYPYALQTKFKVDSLNYALHSIGKKRKKRKHIRSVAKIIKKQYATALKFNANGTKMYITDDNTNATYRYTLPTTFNLASASYDNVSYNYSAAISPTQVSQIAFNNDGTKLYISSNEVITQCSLSTPYDPSTFTTDSKSFDAGSQVDEATNITFNDDGTKMLMGDMNDATVHQYSLGTAFDISTTSYDNVTHTFTEDTSIRGLTFADNGSKMFMAGTQNDRIYQYSVE